MATEKKYGLLGFHFLIVKQHSAAIRHLLQGYTVTDAVLDYTNDIAVSDVDAAISAGNYRDLTVHYKPEGDFRMSLSFTPYNLQVWFGFYPHKDLSPFHNTLSQLLQQCYLCACGFEIEIFKSAAADIRAELSHYLPVYIVENGETIKLSNGDTTQESIVAEHFTQIINL